MSERVKRLMPSLSLNEEIYLEQLFVDLASGHPQTPALIADIEQTKRHIASSC